MSWALDVTRSGKHQGEGRAELYDKLIDLLLDNARHLTGWHPTANAMRWEEQAA
jgi:hypothetical protein